MGKRKIKGIEVGGRFGRWTVIDWSNSRCIHVFCECGSHRYIPSTDLIKGKSTSCGKCFDRKPPPPEIEVGTLYFINCVRGVICLDPIIGTTEEN